MLWTSALLCVAFFCLLSYAKFFFFSLSTIFIWVLCAVCPLTQYYFQSGICPVFSVSFPPSHYKHYLGFSQPSKLYNDELLNKDLIIDWLTFVSHILAVFSNIDRSFFPILYSHNERKVTCKHPVSSLPSQDNCIFVVNEQ